MNTLHLFAAKNLSIPASTSWHLANRCEFRGKQSLYSKQLNVLINDIVTGKIKVA